MKAIKIESETEFEQAAQRIDALANSIPGTPEAQELRALIKAIIHYTRVHTIFSKN